MPTGSGPAAWARGLRKTYPGDVPALDGVDLEVAYGQVTALIGANGSGKTTLLRVLAGELAPTAGALGGPEGAGAGAAARRRVGYVSQEVALDGEMTGGETLDLFAALHGLGRGAARARLAALGPALELGGALLARPVATYSGGQRRRLHVALGLLHDPALLLLDEPTAGLDVGARRGLWALLGGEAGRGRAVVVATHDLAEAARASDVVALFDRGRLAARDAPDRLVARHGQPSLRVRFAGGPPARLERLVEAVERLDRVSAVRWDGERLAVEAADAAAAARPVWAALEAMDAEVAEVEVLRPDLATAYLQLTGRRLDPGPRPARRAVEREAAAPA
jgi:ABC-2 type transport system ATP-binding protein